MMKDETRGQPHASVQRFGLLPTLAPALTYPIAWECCLTQRLAHCCAERCRFLSLANLPDLCIHLRLLWGRR